MHTAAERWLVISKLTSFVLHTRSTIAPPAAGQSVVIHAPACTDRSMTKLVRGSVQVTCKGENGCAAFIVQQLLGLVIHSLALGLICLGTGHRQQRIEPFILEVGIVPGRR